MSVFYFKLNELSDKVDNAILFKSCEYEQTELFELVKNQRTMHILRLLFQFL